MKVFCCKSADQEPIQEEPNVNHQKTHQCQKCWNANAEFHRKLDLDRIPKEYLLDGSSPTSNLIMFYLKKNLGDKYDPSNKYYLINFPKEHILTKYDYYLCKTCYSFEDHNCVPWNYWTRVL